MNDLRPTGRAVVLGQDHINILAEQMRGLVPTDPLLIEELGLNLHVKRELSHGSSSNAK
jgi:hypothetical protein